MATLTFFKSTKIIEVDAPQTEVTVQDLVNQIRDYEDNLVNMDIKRIADITGKDSLGGGNFTGITLKLLHDWRVRFEDRCGPTFEQMRVSGGNLIATNVYCNNPIATSSFTQVTVELSLSPSITGTNDEDLRYLVESLRGNHKAFGQSIYWSPYDGCDGLDGSSVGLAVQTFCRAHALTTDNAGDVIFALANDPSGETVTTEKITISNNRTLLRGPGQNFVMNPATTGSPTVTLSGIGNQITGVKIKTAACGVDNGITVTGSFSNIQDLTVECVTGNGIEIICGEKHRVENIIVKNAVFDGVKATDIKTSFFDRMEITNNTGHGLSIYSTISEDSSDNVLSNSIFNNNKKYQVSIFSGTSRTSIRDTNLITSDGFGRLDDLGLNTVDTNNDGKINVICAGVAQTILDVSDVKTETEDILTKLETIEPSVLDILSRVKKIETSTNTSETCNALIKTAVDTILKFHQNRQKILNNQLIIYDDDDTTPLISFNLFNKAGAATETEPFDKIPTT